MQSQPNVGAPTHDPRVCSHCKHGISMHQVIKHRMYVTDCECIVMGCGCTDLHLSNTTGTEVEANYTDHRMTGYAYPVPPQGTLHDSTNKSGVDQIPAEIQLMIGDVFTYGEKKYARDNWKKGTHWHEFIGSALRHIFKFSMGEWLDDESGHPHLVHAIVNCMFLIYYHQRGLGIDDRDTKRT